MSITKGAMLISNANAVGAELVNKLGGTGYKPVEWADAINLLGISNDNKASALAGITEGTYTGDERGSIKYSNCNEVGSMLNKKFSTDRGFKPVEWESAISKLTPLAEGTVSGSVVSFPNGADDVPLKSCEVALPASLDGYSSVDVVQTGKNLCQNNLSTETVSGVTITVNADGTIKLDGTATARIVRRLASNFGLKAGNYTLSCGTPLLPNSCYFNFNGGGISVSCTVNNPSQSFTLSADSTITYIRIDLANGATFDNLVLYPMLEVGSTATAYKPYTAPTTYTASLGRTIYGGQADIVNGIAEPTNYLDTANAETNTNNSVSITCDGKGKYTATGTATGGSANITFTLKTPCEIKSGDYFHCGNSVANGSVSITLQKQDNTSILYFALSPINRIVDLSSYVGQTIHSIRFYAANGASFEMTLTPMLCYNSAVTPYSPYFTPFTFTGQEVPTRLGYNAFWSDNGDTEVTYRKDPDIPDPPVQLLNMNNENNENNDN